MALRGFLQLALAIICFSTEAARLPLGFQERIIAENLNPTAMALAPDGRLFLAMKDGRIMVVRDDELQSDPYLSIAVDNFNERGLSGIAIHPEFETNQLIYVYYTVPGENHNRLSTFQGNGDFAIPSSEEVLLDLDPMAGTIHNGGAMKFGPDGKLYLAVGDGAQAGTAQDMNSLLGKFLRLNDDGSIPEDNPFYQTLEGNLRAIWALGFRNPFTFDIQPETGRIFSNDVGGSDFEEINEVVKGKNYGWPIIEGYRNQQTPPSNYQDPIYAYSHDEGCSIIGAAFYNPVNNNFPARYLGRYFFADYCEGYIKILDADDGSVVEVFATDIDRPIAMTVTESGEMYYLERAGIGGGSMQDNTGTTNGRLWKITFTGSGEPSITRHPESLLIAVGENATFSVSASGSEPFNYQWQADGVDIPGAIESSFTFLNTALTDDGMLFRCVVSNADGQVLSSEARLSVTSNTRPEPVITVPGSGFLYQAGNAIAFEGLASDAEDGTIPASQLTWWIDFHHDDHTHPGLSPVSGIASGNFVVPRVGETSDNVWYRIYLRATDSDGLSQVVYHDVYPQKSQFEITSNTPGLYLNVDGKLLTTPVTITSVVGITRTLEASLVQQSDDNYYVFQDWNGTSNANLFTFDTPGENLELTVNYQPVPLGQGDGLLGRYFSDQDQTLDGAPTFKRIDPVIDFDWAGGSPHGSISPDFFTVRWIGFVQPLFTADHTFYTVSDDGVRLWINDQLLIDKWIPQARTEWSGNIELEAGVNYPIKLEYYEQQGAALMELWWGNSLVGKEVIPSSQLLRPDLVLSTEEPIITSELLLFPIPAKQQLQMQLQLQIASPVTLEVFDSMGRKVWEHETKPGQKDLDWTLEVGNWQSGTYIIKLITAQGALVRKFVKL